MSDTAKVLLKEKGNYKPLLNQRKPNMPKTWKDYQKEWPAVNWDNSILELKFDVLDEADRQEALQLLPQ